MEEASLAEAKTKPTKDSVKAFIAKVPDAKRREDCNAVLKLMSEVTGAKPEMWGPSIIGFGRYLYKYDSGREGEWMLTGFSPRKGDLTLYIMGGLDAFPDLMKRLGKHRAGKACLYIKTLAEIDLGVLRELLQQSVTMMAAKRTDKKAATKKEK
jgi:predicted GIY-YIG superfamily endonuclease